MYDLAIAILGSGDTTYNNAADLLWDYLPDNYIVYIPSYINSDGMKNVWKFLQDSEIHYERVKRSKIIEILESSETKSRQLVILNSGGIENEISHCLETKIPVLDLTRGLFEVTEVPAPGPESHAETTKPETHSPVTPKKDLVAGDSTERQPISRPEAKIAELESRISWHRKEIERLTELIHVHSGESGWEPSLEPVDNPKAGMDAVRTDPGLAEGAGLTAYWKSKRGKMRKAGKSKARPGEALVYLTQEEIDNLE